MTTPTEAAPVSAASARGRTSRSRGRSRELQVAEHYRQHGYVAYRLAWGHADVLACRLLASIETIDGTRAVIPRFELVQVKSTSRPYERFGPSERRELIKEAEAVGAHAVLAWWPKGGQLRLIPSTEWPS